MAEMVADRSSPKKLKRSAVGGTGRAVGTDTGRRIKKRRDSHRWTQEDLAKRAGLSAMTISHYETGRRMPSVNNIIKIADALRITTDHLLRFGSP